MPTSIIDLSVSAETGAVPQPTYNDIVVFGTSLDAPSAGFNEVVTYSDSNSVEDDFGDEVPEVVTASDAIEQMSVEEWKVVAAERQTVTDEDTGADGELENAPVYGDVETVTAEVDAEEVTVVPKAISPPDAEEDPEEGEVFINFQTGGIVFGDDAGTEYSVDYEYVNWGHAQSAAASEGVDLAGLADYNVDRAGIGDLDETVSWASGEDVGVVAMLENGFEYEDEEAALDAAHDIGGYVPSGNLMTIAHKSGDDVASYVLGQLGTNRPWFDPFWDGDGYPFSTSFYNRSLVGDRSSPGTFEGGDTENEEGNANVIINVEGTTVLSNSLTTAGASSNYAFWDIGRTEEFLAAETKRALTSLRLRLDKIPYTTNGRAQILGEIRGTLNQYARGSNAPLSEINVSAPEIDKISEDDRADRTFPGITIDGKLSGNVHEFGVELTLRV